MAQVIDRDTGERAQQATRPWRYALGMFGTSIPITMFLTYMAFFYVDSLGLDGRVYAGIMVGYAVLDALDNPVYGHLSDRTRTRWGRRRPWLVVGAPLLALSLVGFFSPPAAAQAGWALVAWFAVFAVLTETVDSLINANYGALLPELFPEARRRAKANALRQGAQLVAMIIGVALTPLMASLVGYQATAAIYGTLAAAVIVFMALGAHENPAALTAPTPRLLESVRAILRTPAFWQIAITLAAYAGATALILAGTPFFVKYALQLPDSQATYLLASVILVAIGSLAVWTRVVQRLGALRVWRWALAGFALSLLPMYFASSLATAVAAGALIGVGLAGVLVSADLVVARVLDVDTARTGHRREGMFIAAFGFFNRLNAVLKSLAFLAIAGIFGFISGDEPGERPGEAARFLMVVFPAMLMVVAAVMARFVRLPDHTPGTPAPAHLVDPSP